MVCVYVFMCVCLCVYVFICVVCVYMQYMVYMVHNCVYYCMLYVYILVTYLSA
jgi:hypothetical protein